MTWFHSETIGSSRLPCSKPSTPTLAVRQKKHRPDPGGRPSQRAATIRMMCPLENASTSPSMRRTRAMKASARAAAIKAFIVNRVGDFGFALGIFLVFVLFGSVAFEGIFPRVGDLASANFRFLGIEWHALTLACLLLFMGAMGKSAQFLLHTWLPDAMEGPTPVSALIHAATMVTAGVFMVARLSPLFELAPNAQAVVTLVGGTTAFFAATVALVQNDIKRVVAYSTCSQLGYMFVARAELPQRRPGGPDPGDGRAEHRPQHRLAGGVRRARGGRPGNEDMHDARTNRWDRVNRAEIWSSL